MVFIDNLVLLNSELTGERDWSSLSKEAKEMYEHPSLITVANGFMRTEAFALYLNKKYPICEGRSDEWVVSFLIYNYVHFVALLNNNLHDELYQNMSPPHILDQIWHQHLLDNKGYNDFCLDHIGELLYHDPSPSFTMMSYETYFRISQTIIAYHKCDDYEETMTIYSNNGIWWDQIKVPVMIDLTKPTTQVTSQETRNNDVLKRARRATELLEEQEAIESSKRGRTENGFQLHLKHITGRHFLMDVTERTIMDEVAERVYSELGYELDQFRIMHDGRVCYTRPCPRAMHDNDHQRIDTTRTLKEFDIESDTTLHIVMKLRGC
ncbi:hypothetical protein CYMTET_27272 [Cymbomonas tetramitiformis]|uniref:Ubiquitin-like domain-containing protein n=1 Tax=Cymbomonas tetramitiformis TaxID=36881 RepID=A0AAE0KXD8_9CHLO|nr:hypothetical protein CYMTET_27272 [Cymbomonas tetramitiformis]